MEVVYLKKTSRILTGHLWVFQNEIAGSLKKYEPGTIVELRDKNDQFLGRGYINPHSFITIRLLTRRKEKIDHNFFETRIKNAISYRQRFLRNMDSCRLIYSESDLLSGLIVDKYEDWLVIQSLTAGMDKFLPEIDGILDSLIKPSTIFLKNDTPLRTLESLELKTEFLKGTGEDLPVIREGYISLKVDPVHGQKTGFFLDQRENRLLLSELIKEGKGLDLFCYTGAWGLQLVKRGAHVLFIDDSERALSMAKENAELNGLSKRCTFLKTDVFDYLSAPEEEDFDFIVLDPPAFVKAKTKIEEAIRGYRFINSASMRLLKKGGILATSSCSHHISRELFLDLLRQAARGAGRTIRIIEFRSQAKDHPVLLHVPETEYLKCAILEVL